MRGCVLSARPPPGGHERHAADVIAASETGADESTLTPDGHVATAPGCATRSRRSERLAPPPDMNLAQHGGQVACPTARPGAGASSRSQRSQWIDANGAACRENHRGERHEDNGERPAHEAQPITRGDAVEDGRKGRRANERRSKAHADDFMPYVVELYFAAEHGRRPWTTCRQ
jgi:hypothetical protein